MDDEKKITVEEFATILWENKDIIQKMTRPQVDKLIDMLRSEESGSVA